MNVGEKLDKHTRVFVLDTENLLKMQTLQDYCLNEDDVVVLVYSENSRKFSIDDVNFLYMTGCFIIFEKVTVGFSNALDFQLIMYITHLVTLYPKEHLEIYILSSDKCYSRVVNYLYKLQDGNYNVNFIFK